MTSLVPNNAKRSLISVFVASSAAMAITLVATSISFAQAKAPAKVNDHTLRATDGWPIAITYYESSEGKTAPVAILLHTRKTNRNIWKGGFAKQLQGMGFAVIAVDLRKHGDSKPAAGKVALKARPRAVKLSPTDYKKMAYMDLEAVKEFVFQEHQKKKLNMRKTSIVAPGFSAPIALAFAYADWLKIPHPDGPTLASRTPRGQDIRAITLISPELSVPGLNGKVAAYKMSQVSNRVGMPVHFLIMWGKRDTVDGGKGARELLKSLRSIPNNEKLSRVYEASYNTRARGTDLIGRKIPGPGRRTTNTIIGGFLKKHDKDLKDGWVNRQSKLKR